MRHFLVVPWALLILSIEPAHATGLDRSFGDGGTIEFGADSGLQGRGAGPEGAGNVWLAGTSDATAHGEDGHPFVVRLNADGAVDLEVDRELLADAFSETHGITVSSNGFIYVTVRVPSNLEVRESILRLLPSGEPDRSFGSDGILSDLHPRTCQGGWTSSQPPTA
ncbi:MAG: hypothetical protein OEX04_19185 [Acidimicrobiia bacterium]|nr:hypothetical protein [Acidimicrobiia bacterium]MDH4309600.1 hypothetical protein [Acidimicrobiia bacterium]